MYISSELRLAMLAFMQSIMRSRGPDAVIGPADYPYVHRWHLGPHGLGPNCYVHVFFRDDVDRALHDHEYDSVSVVLDGQYDEWFHKEPLVVVGDKYDTYPVLRLPGQVIHRRAHIPHRISLIDGKPCTTLFFTGERYRKWGFLTPLGWVPWREYSERIGATDGNYEEVKR